MNTKKEIISNTKIKLSIEIDANELKPYLDQVYKEVGIQINVPGFRPGNAPRFIIEKEVGSEALEKYTLEKAIPMSYYNAVQKEKIVAIGGPEVKVLKFVPSEGLTFEAEVEVMPEIALPDFSKIEVKKEEIKIEDKEIDESVKYLQEMFAEKKEVARGAKDKDRVEIDFEGSIKGVPFEGGTSKNHPLLLGEKSFIPGFEEELIGMKKDEEKTFDITFPKDYHAKGYAGKTAQFKVKLNLLEEITLPELDDEFAGKIGPFKNIDALREDVKGKLEKEKGDVNERRLEDEILKKITKEAKMEIPKILLAEEKQRMIHEIEHNLSHSGITLDKYLEHTKKNREEFKKELGEEAEKRTKLGLILSEVVKQNDFDIKEEEIEKEIEKIRSQAMPDKKEEIEKYYKDGEGRRSLENNLLAKKAIQLIKKEITIK